jgi:type IV pilus assembly protein PilB
MSVLSTSTEQQVEDALVSVGALSADKLIESRQEASKNHVPLVTYLLNNGYITDEQLTKTTASIKNIPYVNLSSARIDTAILKLLPKDIAERYMAVPLGEMNKRLVVAMLDADNIQAVDFLSNRIGRPLKVYVASEAGIRRVLRQYDARLDTTIDKVFGKELSKDVSERTGESVPTENKNIKTLVEDSPISKALSAILEFAAHNRASDVHVEPIEKELKIRCRIDGVLREVMRLPKDTEPAFISRIKILANLKIDEHRIPQDGQFSIRVDKKDID